MLCKKITPKVNKYDRNYNYYLAVFKNNLLVFIISSYIIRKKQVIVLIPIQYNYLILLKTVLWSELYMCFITVFILAIQTYFFYNTPKFSTLLIYLQLEDNDNITETIFIIWRSSCHMKPCIILS